MFIFESEIGSADQGNDRLEGLDYIAECDLTASGTFNPEQVGIWELRARLAEFARTAADLNKFKKALFRKQTRAEAGLVPYMETEANQSLSVFQTMGHDDLFHGIIGISTEAGEVAEILIKLLDGERVDVTNVREECGDLLWYLSRLMKWADTSFLSEMIRNIKKLRLRHGASGFDKSRDMNRDLDAEHKFLAEDVPNSTTGGQDFS